MKNVARLTAFPDVDSSDFRLILNTNKDLSQELRRELKKAKTKLVMSDRSWIGLGCPRYIDRHLRTNP